MRYLLDTHVWLWAANEPSTLSVKVRKLFEVEEEVFGLSAISPWEVAKKVEKGKLPLPCAVLDWVQGALPETVTLLPLSPEIAVRSTMLKGFHGDPADQIIVATALVHRLTLLTSDTAIRRSRVVPTVW